MYLFFVAQIAVFKGGLSNISKDQEISEGLPSEEEED